MGVNQMNRESANRYDISETYVLNNNLICANICENILDQSLSSPINVSRMFLLKP
jgi:hypothetical protein